ncbi:hypothetical protein [Legionella parisiensis]|uniref:Uncharacterized protein n=1 Tax=Legionella parisiensis TaxID=45071 RepID=A0A1E5JU07_9GAMM|nr:hypothetical protein [Legionella parisiensis]KTD43119.1 hypothetical protein Lpar_1096 [Legionella parisiensis]OEH47999.1 hypothetical protein lpari_01023 [Legionella parisiensis]STX77802.1 Uncharacterised protein [Legionella parisiensis]
MAGDDYGLAEIRTLSDAKDAWESFAGRFFSPEIPPGVDVTFNPELRQFTPRPKKDAKYKHPGFRDKETNELPVDAERTLHSDDFDDFLNGNTVTIPERITLTLDGLKKVKDALERGDYEDEALKTEDHTFYALWLFKQNIITRQQMSTILARAQIPQEYPLERTFHIFANDNKNDITLSPEAKQLWLPALAKTWYGKEFTEEHLTRLLLLLKTAPKSEQIFFISKANPKIVPPEERALGTALEINNAWHMTQYGGKTYDLHFSFGLTEAVQIAKYGINGAAASRTKLGKVGIDAVREGVEFYYRPTAISMPDSGVEATTKGIHGYTDSPMPAVTAHDVFHSKLHNTIRPEFHMMLNHMSQVISKHTKQKWSKTIWELVDREFHSFQYQTIKDLTPKKGAALFVQMLHRNGRDPAFLFKKYDPLELSDDGFAIVWNMVNQPDVWKRLYKIDIDQIGFPYGKLIEKMKDFKKEVGSEHKHPEVLRLKYHFFNVISNNTEFKKICNLLDTLGDKLILDKEQKLVFGKYTKGADKNLTILKFKNFGKEVQIDEGSVKQLIPILVNMRLAMKFGEKNDEAVNGELKKVSGEFKSTYQQSKLSKDLLATSISNLPSLTAKLDFLEACYEEIIHSKGYTRRHATADNMFSFFKNPLTTSQREHIVLLKEKQNELIAQYQKENSLDQNDIAELEWDMKNRGSNLYLCKTERFYLHIDSTVPSARM